MKIYLASPFFNEVELENYKQILSILRDKNLDIYAPLEHQLSREGLTKKEWAYKTFEKDVEQIKNADAVVVLFYGLYSDSGTAWECGYAYAINKPVIAVHVHEGKSNCMINCSSLANLTSIEALKDYDFNNLKPVNWYDREVIG